MAQIALPLRAGPAATARLAVSPANLPVVEALSAPQTWPFRTAVLAGPPRSGKTSLVRWFIEQRLGEAIDHAEQLAETELFHHWNRAQERGIALLLATNAAPGQWRLSLPDLRSRLGAALHLEIGAPDDALLADLLALHAEQRGLALGPDAAGYLIPRSERSYAGIERLVAAIDRISLERKAPPTLAVWRQALDETFGPSEPRLL